jgi:hypothetical protein
MFLRLGTAPYLFEIAADGSQKWVPLYGSML